MNEIKCPNCGTLFQIDENDYESIVKQIKDKEFNKELESREEKYKIEKESAIKILESKHDKELTEQLTLKDNELVELKCQLKTKELEAESKIEKKYLEELSKKDLEINELKNEVKNKDYEKTLALTKAISDKDKEIISLNSKINSNINEFTIKEQSLKNEYEEKIRVKDEQITYYKDLKAKLSTKMIGESLEQHCNNEFNSLRPLFKNAFFEKDNDAKTGSKGDFIFREYDDGDGLEIISIMFEMKNEADETSTKHKNEDFFKELDKDRIEKKCEYAVLVSLLEIDNEYYNNGIVDVSHRYEKMYVIRPQFFIPLITLLRGAALNTLDYKKELELVKNQNIDISHFEENINSFKEGFARNYKLASDKFNKAIEEIDKSIDHLQKIKGALQASEKNLRLANNKSEDLSIKKLTSNNPTMKKMFEKLHTVDENNKDISDENNGAL